MTKNSSRAQRAAPRWRRALRLAADVLQIVAGSLLMATGINAILVPNQVIPGGLAGYAVIVNHLTGLPIGMMLLAANVPLFVLGWKFAGGMRFIYRSLIGMLTFTLGIDLLGPLLPVFTDDRLLVAVYGGLFEGLGVALVFRGRASSGGSDIIARIMRRQFGTPPGKTILAINACAYILAAYFFGVEPAMIALLVSFVSTKTLDTTLNGLSASRAAFVVTAKEQPVVDAILSHLGRGVTVLPGRGGFSNEELSLLYVVVPRADVFRLRTRVLEVDPEAFITFSPTQDVTGGFAVPAADH